MDEKALTLEEAVTEQRRVLRKFVVDVCARHERGGATDAEIAALAPVADVLRGYFEEL